jgi:alginate O-acetyltransferase complex protein AlgI
MLFHTQNFALFLISVFALFWLLVPRNLTAQNILLIVASYVFYGFWDVRFLLLLCLSTLIDFYTGLRIHSAQSEAHKKRWLWLSILLNFGLLGYFKYVNFFIENFTATLHAIGIESAIPFVNVLLPVGISFYTFHGISYVLDIYYKRIEPTRDFVAYALFVSFFPLLVAGPIERANHLLPQLKVLRTFNYKEAVLGLKQILWGLFKKMVIADNCMVLADHAFAYHDTLPASTLALGAVFFSFQIYGDFSGYSDIAIGTGRLFGISLLKNFSFPYFAQSLSEFWKRWHISLTSWFRDYLYLPLGGSKVSKLLVVRNVFIVFLVSGFWHGAAWTFLVWGFLNALFFVAEGKLKSMPFFGSNQSKFTSKQALKMSKTKGQQQQHLSSKGDVEKDNNGKQAQPANSHLPSLRQLINMLFTFALVSLLWVFFRAPNLETAFSFLKHLFQASLFTNPLLEPKLNSYVLPLLLFFIWVEWQGRQQYFALENWMQNKPLMLRWSFYASLVFLIGMFMTVETSPFIYFQF